jgi:pimeloyl-ACP methyl ester carboxylesterase
MFYSLAWDWRRDLWEQSERLPERLDIVYNVTGCRPILVGHSYGGRIVHTAIARFARSISWKIAAVLYAVVPFSAGKAQVWSACS